MDNYDYTYKQIAEQDKRLFRYEHRLLATRCFIALGVLFIIGACV